MIKTKKGSKKSKQRSSTKSPRELSPEATSVSISHFDTVLDLSRRQRALHTVVGHYEATAITDGAGVMNQVFGNSPVNMLGWSSFASVFDEYRVLGMRLSFVPNIFSGGATTTVTTSFASVIDYDSASALTSYNSGAYFSSYIQEPTDRKWTRTALMSGVENAGFIPTLTPGNTFYIKTYSTGNTTTLTMGRWDLSIMVQFRGQGI